ncbi:unnamed protein product [Ectocarpus sp. CCAP 1310/34]|nr:unnamed protein product [Ectocarpus sp. CCAP 1310/34]
MFHQDLNRCLDAFIVALNQSCDGKKWYTSRADLQLASLAFCRLSACSRTVPDGG